MDGKIIKIALIGGGVYLVYRYLQSSGLWSQWFGGGNTFDVTDPQVQSKVLAYCHANPGGSISLKNGATALGTTTCAQLIASQTAAPSPQPGIPPAAPLPSAPPNTTPTPVDQTALIAQLNQGMQDQVQRTVGTVSEWNWIWQYKLNKGSNIVTNSANPVDQEITAQDYLGVRVTAGLSGINLGNWANWNQPQPAWRM